jgi:hypothetical protein
MTQEEVDNLRRALRSKRYKISAVTRDSGLEYSTVYNFVHKESMPRIDTYQKLYDWVKRYGSMDHA